jgi:hypothetical protein
MMTFPSHELTKTGINNLEAIVLQEKVSDGLVDECALRLPCVPNRSVSKPVLLISTSPLERVRWSLSIWESLSK